MSIALLGRYDIICVDYSTALSYILVICEPPPAALWEFK